MPKTRSSKFRPSVVVAAVVALVAALFVAPGAAQAYSPNPTVRWAQVDTDNCARLSGTLTVVASSDGCRINDSFDGTFFRKDAGGVAVKIELYVGSTLVAKSEFHPYGEVLYVYDTRDDSDTVYTQLSVGSSGPYYGPYRGPVNGYNSYNLDISEGSAANVSVWDDQGKTDLIEMLQGTA